jgi:hypothetical protein
MPILTRSVSVRSQDISNGVSAPSSSGFGPARSNSRDSFAHPRSADDVMDLAASAVRHEYHPDALSAGSFGRMHAKRTTEKTRRNRSKQTVALSAADEIQALRYWSVGRPCFFFTDKSDNTIKNLSGADAEWSKSFSRYVFFAEFIKGKSFYLAKSAEQSSICKISMRKLFKEFGADDVSVRSMVELENDVNEQDNPWLHVGRAMLSVMYRFGGAGFEQDVEYSESIVGGLPNANRQGAFDRLLFSVAGSASVELIHRIIVAGANPNAYIDTIDHKSALAVAVLDNKIGVVRAFLEFGADPDCKALNGALTGREAALRIGNEEVLNMFAEFSRPRS